MSLYFLIFATMVEGVVFAVVMNNVRQLHSEFSMMNDLQLFSFIWLTMTNFGLFIVL